jgi:hypothetical protein
MVHYHGDQPDDDATHEGPVMAVTEAQTEATLEPGTKVDVRRRFDNNWAQGFEVVAVVQDGYRLRRVSDGQELPVAFPAADVRRHRKRDMWWM